MSKYEWAVLWASIVHQNKERAWKTRFHEDGQPCFGGGWFLVMIDTPKGAYGYHYEDKYWDMFDCVELPKAKFGTGIQTRMLTGCSAWSNFTKGAYLE